MSTVQRLASVVVLVMCFAASAGAQGVDTGSLRGRVTDATGAALPGVTVTAVSEVVMGGQLTAVTSEEGLYRFPSLPPGLYEVRMELPGFQAVAIAGVRMNVGLALTIDRQMTVSSVQETLTVVGESPIVDTKNTSGEVSWTPELLQNLPSSRDLWSTMQQVPGLVMAKENVGGIESPFLSNFQVHGSIRGSHQYNFNGLDMSDMHSGIGLGYFNTDSMEEIQFSTSGISAEHSRGGLILNTVTKSGGNKFMGQAAGYYEGSALQSTNVDDELRQRGVQGAGAPLDYLYDVSGSLGGPIQADRIWFFAAGRRYVVAPTVLNCTLPDGGECTDGVRLPNVTGKVTAQIGPANRLMVLYDRGEIHRPNREVSQFVRPEAAYSEDFHYDMWQGKFDRILSQSLLMQAAVGRGSPPFRLGYHETHEDGASSAFDEITRVRFDAASQDFFQQGDILVLNTNLTYFKDRFLGGAHDFKFGAEHRRGKLLQRHLRAGDVERRYQNGAAYRVIAYNTPVEQVSRNYSVAAYGQDSIRLGSHLTLNLGVRTEWWRGDVPEQSNQPSSFADVFGGGATYPAQEGVMEWTTVSPRLGLAYDVRGNSRIVAKATYGRYYFQVRTTDLNSFSNRNAVATATFDWLDQNGNNVPDYPSEFGTLRSLNLPRLRRIEPGLDAPYTDEVSASIEFGLTERTSISGRYTYRKNGKILATTDLALPDEAFSIPSSAVDPLTGARIDYWSLSPAYRTVVNQEVLTQFDSNYTRYNGVDLSFNRRFDGKWLLIGSVTVQDNYGRVGGYLDRNDREIFPYGQAGLDARVIGKIVANFALPWQSSGSVFYRHSGGMNSNNSGNINTDMARLVQVSDVTTGTLYRIRVEESGSFRQDATNIVDVRLSKTFTLGRSRIETLVDGFNILNANNILATGTITGSNLNVPLRLVTPRVFRIGAKVDF